MHEGKYNIKAASTILGIPSGTLRAWERRYQFIAPDRNESGHRLYSDKQIQTLKGLIEKTKQGFTISQAVALLDREGSTEAVEEDSIITNNQTRDYSEKLIKALLAFEEDKAHSIINQVFSMFTVEIAVIEILGASLVKIGDMWENGEINTAHEHFASSILQARISFIMHTQPSNPMMPKAVMVCGPEEKHELGLLIFTLYLRRKGYGTIYLGPSIAENDLETVLDAVNPGYLFLSCTMPACYTKTMKMLPLIKQKYPQLKIGLGGTGFAGYEEDLFVGDTPTEWNKWLNR